jgi:hypothetical protein
MEIDSQRTMRASFNLIALFLAALFATAPCFAQAPSSTEQARFLAGLPVRGSALEDYTRGSMWAEHAAALDAAWGKAEQRQIASVRAWAGSYLPGNSGPAYYMFSGPDFLYANLFFRNASTYILCGTEPIGAVPDITRIPPTMLAPALENLRRSMKTMLSFHYFITKEMRVDLQRNELGGTLPILYVFLARLGYSIHQVEPVSTPAAGVRIVFSGGGGRTQSLYYFKVDLSNGSCSNFLSWCRSQGPGPSLVKAASYLLHSDGFSQVRRFLLDQSTLIVQDDSGIPLRNFDDRWSLRFFGNYAGPIEIFAKHYQPDLMAAYQRSHPAPLGFAFGYHWQPERGMLMLAVRK